MKLKVMRRIDAIDAGLTHYYTGKPCQRGHVTMRYTLSGQCIDCNYQHGKERYAEAKKKMQEKRGGGNG